MCEFAAQKAKFILGCMKSNMASKSKEVILPLYSALVGPHLECCIYLWQKKDIKLLDWVQRRVTKLLRGVDHLLSEDRLRKLELFSIGRRRLH